MENREVNKYILDNHGDALLKIYNLEDINNGVDIVCGYFKKSIEMPVKLPKSYHFIKSVLIGDKNPITRYEELEIKNVNITSKYNGKRDKVIKIKDFISSEHLLISKKYTFDKLLEIIDKYFIEIGLSDVCKCIAYQYKELNPGKYPLMTFIACSNLVFRWIDDTESGNGNRPIDVWSHAFDLCGNDYRSFIKDCFLMECEIWKALDFTFPGNKYSLNDCGWSKEEIVFKEYV